MHCTAGHTYVRTRVCTRVHPLCVRRADSSICTLHHVCVGLRLSPPPFFFRREGMARPPPRPHLNTPLSRGCESPSYSRKSDLVRVPIRPHRSRTMWSNRTTNRHADYSIGSHDHTQLQSGNEEKLTYVILALDEQGPRQTVPRSWYK